MKVKQFSEEEGTRNPDLINNVEPRLKTSIQPEFSKNLNSAPILQSNRWIIRKNNLWQLFWQKYYLAKHIFWLNKYFGKNIFFQI